MWLSAPLALFFAPVIRRFGAWRMLLIDFVCQAMVMFVLAFSTEIWQVYGFRILMGVGKVSMIISVPVILMDWFQDRFAIAIAIVRSSASAGG